MTDQDFITALDAITEGMYAADLDDADFDRIVDKMETAGFSREATGEALRSWVEGA